MLPYDQIPLPFGNLHTTNFDNHEAVVAAVVAQLARPVAPPVVLKKLRYGVLTWFGIVGGALTIVNHWTNFITLSDWAHWLVGHFSLLMHQFWEQVGAIFRIRISKETSSWLTLLLFYFSMSYSSLLSVPNRLEFLQAIRGFWTYLLTIIIVSIMISCMFAYHMSTLWQAATTLAIIVLSFELLFNVYLRERQIILRKAEVGFATESLNVFLTLAIYSLLLAIIYPLFRSAFDSDAGESVFYCFPIVLLVVMPLLMVPPTTLRKRAVTIFLMLSFIIGLSEVSKQVEKFRTTATTVETH